MYVHLKQSGELLQAQGEPGEIWTPNGSRASTEKIAALHGRWSDLGLRGLMLVSGAGNLMRGDGLRQQGLAEGVEDPLGRLFTVANTIFLARELQQQKVPVSTFIAETMRYEDAANPHVTFPPYDIEAVMEAYQQERVVLVAGGTGKNKQSTDAAVVEYAAAQMSRTPEEKVIALKGTKFDGVYESDPRTNARARRFARISAGYMLKNYKRFCAVDSQSLEVIQEAGVPLRVYADGHHDLETVLDGRKDEIGTLIVADDIEPELAA